jgi:hypothetical protein
MRSGLNSKAAFMVILSQVLVKALEILNGLRAIKVRHPIRVFAYVMFSNVEVNSSILFNLSQIVKLHDDGHAEYCSTKVTLV